MIHSQPALRQYDGKKTTHAFWCLCGKRLSVPFESIANVVTTCHICYRVWIGVQGANGDRFDLIGEDVSISKIRKR